MNPLVLLLSLVLMLAGAALAQPVGDDVPPAPPALETLPEPVPQTQLRGTDVAEDEAARRRSGIDAQDLPIGTRCTSPGAELEIAGIGRAVYDRIAVDTAAGSARLSGGVCIEVPEADLIIRALYFELTNLSGSELGEGVSPRISALQAVVDMGGWRLSVASLQGSIDDLTLRNIRLTAPGVAGVAAAGRIAGAGDVFEASLEEVALATRNYHLDARTARLAGDVLLLEDASGTTCVCEVERFRLLGAAVRADLSTGAVIVGEPYLRVLGVRIPLGRELSLGGDGPQLEMPFAFVGRRDLGSVAILRGSPVEGVRVEIGAATEPMPAPLAVLDVRRDGDLVRVEADGRGLLLEARRQRPLFEGAWVAGYSESVLREDDPRLRAGAEAGWSGRRQDDLGAGVTATNTLSARAGAEVAAEPVPVLPNDPAGAPEGTGAAALRLPFAVEARSILAVGPVARLELRGGVSGAGYLAAPVFGRAALTLAPSLVFAGSDARLTLSAERRWTYGDGPFEFDVVSPRFRLLADAAVGVGPFAADARVAWRLFPEDEGAEDVRLRAHADLPLGDDWILRPALRSELAGVFGGPGDEDWIEAELALSRGEDTRVALRAREGVEPWMLRDLVLSAQAPFDVQDVRLVPYLAVDMAPVLQGGGPQLAGHGLRVYVEDCCGTVILGYRMNDGEWTFELDMRLPPLDLGEPPLSADAVPSSMLDVLPGEPPPAPAAPGGPVPPEEGGASEPPGGGGGGPGGPVPREPEEAPEDPSGADADSGSSGPASRRYGVAS